METKGELAKINRTLEEILMEIRKLNVRKETVYDDSVDDELYNQGKDLVIESRKASASYLQRKLRIGYSRAARLLDLLEANKIIGSADGVNPRKVLVKR